MPDSGQQKENRGQASLVSKLTFLEVWRRFWLIVSIDILIILLFLAAMLYYFESFLNDADLSQLSDNPAAGYTVTYSDERPSGRTLHPRIAGLLQRGPDIVYDLWSDGGVYARSFLSDFETLNYSLATPYVLNQDTRAFVNSGKYTIITFSLARPARLFHIFFTILLYLEAIGFICDISKIRKSIRRALRPIYDLTVMAQKINIKTNPRLALPDAQELHLSGAIDTLNNITENDLDLRIVISDERQELRGLAEAINAMLDRLDAAYRSQLRFVSDASHELRTPIAVIQGYVNLLDRWGKNDQVTLQESIDAIKSEASGMQDLVEQLLFLARSDNRSITLSVETVDTYALADEVLRETQMIDPSHEFTSRLTEGLKVRGDVQLLKQAFRIFVDNAIKYTPKGGLISISTVSEDNYAKISVTDNGIGIPAEDLSKVFDRFFRSDESRTRETGGTGLGLSIAKWIIDRHGGFVEIISREDFGTKVTVALPEYKGV